MSDLSKPIPVSLARPGRYCLPDDLKFVSLARPQGKEIVRIRFCRGAATILDIPVSGETLADLARVLTPLHGNLPEEMPEAIETFRQQGGVLD